MWGFYLKPSKRIKESFSIGNLEILVWVVDLDDFQARTVMRAVDIATEEKRLGKDFILIVARDPDTANLVENVSPQISSINMIGFSTGEIIQLIDNSEEFLRRLRTSLYIKDLYWTVDAIKIPRYFYGHNKLLSEIASSLANKQSNIGLFGLRKMGKTSFLYRLLETLNESYDCYLSYLDIQLLDAVSPSAEYFLWSLGRAILDSLGKKNLKGLLLFGQHSSFYEINSREAIPEQFVRDFETILGETKKQFIIALDEIELMAPPQIIKGSNWSPKDFIRIWRLLRAISQQNPGRVSFFITGTNPRIIEENIISESDNPIYNFFEKRYLSPFTSEDSEKLLQDIGSLIGIQWNNQALKMVHERTGGHPLLLRAYGSVLHTSREHKDRTKVVKDTDISINANQFLSKVEPQISQMVNVLSKYYENEFFLLQTLAEGKVSEFKEYADAFPDDISHLKGYGIIEFSSSRCFIKVEPLQTWLTKKSSSRSSRSRASDINMIGERIGCFEISSIIGHSGGFSYVYKAAVVEENHGFDIDKESVAVKILKDGSILRLQREVDVLSKFDHPNIVKLITYGQTDDGKAYLVMEYLEGSTLRDKCQRVLRLSPSEVKGIASKLLSALNYMHPNDKKVNKLRQKLELSPIEYAELELARHGKIHRDIKPENIILTADRGPVLIDFNISVSANDPMMTVSHTPGYLPEDLISGYQQWTTDVDLYQLGLTLAQAATGISYEFSGERDRERLDDLRMQLHKDLPPDLAMGLSKLFAKTKYERFESAEEALRHIKNT